MSRSVALEVVWLGVSNLAQTSVETVNQEVQHYARVGCCNQLSIHVLVALTKDTRYALVDCLVASTLIARVRVKSSVGALAFTTNPF